MAEATKIEWCDHTSSPWHGCSRVSSGCDHCYAETMSRRHPGVLGIWGDDGVRVKSASFVANMRRWQKQAAAKGETVTVFPSICDPFEDRPELEPLRSEMFYVADECKNVTLLLLTKRPENIRRMWPSTLAYRANVWLGASVEDQQRADERIPHLLACRGLSPVLFLSCEPLLSALDLSPWLQFQGPGWRFSDDGSDAWPGLDWVIVGGESGPHARPMHPEWARGIRDQCIDSGVPFFFKQWGEWQPVDYEEGHWPESHTRYTFGAHTQLSRVGKRAAGRVLDGREWNEFPRVEADRDFPQSTNT